jgi:hypothetical protein
MVAFSSLSYIASKEIYRRHLGLRGCALLQLLLLDNRPALALTIDSVHEESTGQEGNDEDVFCYKVSLFVGAEGNQPTHEKLDQAGREVRDILDKGVEERDQRLERGNDGLEN